MCQRKDYHCFGQSTYTLTFVLHANLTYMQRRLDYRVPVNGSVFLNTNITYSGNGTYLDHFSGQLVVGINPDSSVSDAAVHVTMHYTSPQLRNATNVCLMRTGQGGGVYLFVRNSHPVGDIVGLFYAQTPMNLTASDGLRFNITLLLPQNNSYPSTRLIPQLLCHLPNFQHIYQQMDPYVTFGSIILGGAQSGVSIEVRETHHPMSGHCSQTRPSRYKHHKRS